MRKMLFLALLLPFALSTGCLYSVTLPGPNGVERKVVPFGGTIIVRAYNNCAPWIVAEGLDHRVKIPYGSSAELLLPNTLGQGNQQLSAVFKAFADEGEKQGMGMTQQFFSPDYNAYVTRKQYIIGGQYQHIYDSNGRDACRQI